MDVYRAKKHLKGKGISVHENLTEKRAEIYYKAREIIGIKNTWTWEGRIFCKHDERRILISDMSDIPGYTSDDEEEDGSEEE